jgi:hypothetical protein
MDELDKGKWSVEQGTVQGLGWGTRTVSTSSGESPRTSGQMVRSTASSRMGRAREKGRARGGREGDLYPIYRGRGEEERGASGREEKRAASTPLMSSVSMEGGNGEEKRKH